MAKHVVIVGGGAVGTHLASLLLAGGHQVTVIEVQRDEIPRLQRELSPDAVTVGNGTDPAILEAAGIRQADVVAAVTGTDETPARLRCFAASSPILLAPMIMTVLPARSPKIFRASSTAA